MRDLAISSLIRLIGLAVLCLGCGLTGQVWAGPCQVPSELVQLARHIAPATSGAPLSRAEAERLYEVLDGISERAMVKTLEENGLASLTPTMFALVTEANKLASGRGGVKGWYVQRLLRTLESESVIACQQATGTGYQEAQQEREGGVLTRDKTKPVTFRKIEETLENNRALSLGVLVAALGIVVVSLFAIDFLVRWGMAMIYNRKACRIPAAIRIGASDVGGSVMTLGRGGFRFQPDSPHDLDMKLEGRPDPNVTLVVEHMELAAVLSQNYGELSDFRFATRLGLSAQKALLSLSTMSPYSIRKSRGAPKPTQKVLEEVDFDAEPVELDTVIDAEDGPSDERIMPTGGATQ